MVKDGETDILFFEQAQLQLRTGPDGFIKVSCKMVYKSGIEPIPLRFQGQVLREAVHKRWSEEWIFETFLRISRKLSMLEAFPSKAADY